MGPASVRLPPRRPVRITRQVESTMTRQSAKSLRRISPLSSRLPLGLVLALAALSLAAGGASAATLPAYNAFPINTPDPQPEYGAGGAANPSPTGTAFGERLRSLGDLDKDGVRDLLVTNTHFDRNGLVDVGRIWIFSGKTRQLLQTIDHPNPQASSQFGFWVARLGDVNSDGTPDWVTSAPSEVVNGIKQGQVYVFSGKTGTVLRTIDQPDAPQLNGDFGGNIIGPGDLNGDGVTDFVATSSGAFTSGTFGNGAAYAFNGKTGALLYRVLNPAPQTPGSQFGFGPSEDGDVNGDGTNDFQVGSPRHDVTGATDNGISYTINGKPGAVLWTENAPDPPQPNARFGQADQDNIAPGDITGDGRPDIFIDGFLSNDGAFTSAGAAYLFNGATGQFIRALRDPNPVASGSFGASDAPAGDIDKDGRPDLMVSSRGQIGRVTIFGGVNLTKVITSFADPQNQLNALFGTGVAYLGDVNGDKQPDYFVSSRSADLNGTPNIGIVWAFISVPPPVYALPKVVTKPKPKPTTAKIRPKATRPRVSARQRKHKRYINVGVKGSLTGNAGRSCVGKVSIAIRVGKKRVGRARATMGSNCRFSKRTRVRIRKLPRRLRPRSHKVV